MICLKLWKIYHWGVHSILILKKAERYNFLKDYFGHRLIFMKIKEQFYPFKVERGTFKKN